MPYINDLTSVQFTVAIAPRPSILFPRCDSQQRRRSSHLCSPLHILLPEHPLCNASRSGADLAVYKRIIWSVVLRPASPNRTHPTTHRHRRRCNSCPSNAGLVRLWALPVCPERSGSVEWLVYAAWLSHVRKSSGHAGRPDLPVRPQASACTSSPL